MSYHGTVFPGSEMNYQKATDYLGNKDARPYGYQTFSRGRQGNGREYFKYVKNTRIERKSPDSIAIHLWSTDIITLYADGRIVLNAGGWYTATTKTRINSFLDGWSIGSEKGQWTVSSPDSFDYKFESGMTIKDHPDTPPLISDPLEKVLGHELPDYSLETIGQAIAGLDLSQCQKFWRQAKYRMIIAQYCRGDFLPLVIGSPIRNEWREEGWRKIAADRLQSR